MLDDKDSAYCKVAKLLYPVLSNANLGVFFLAFVLFCFVCLSVFCFLFFFFRSHGRLRFQSTNYILTLAKFKLFTCLTHWRKHKLIALIQVKLHDAVAWRSRSEQCYARTISRNATVMNHSRSCPCSNYRLHGHWTQPCQHALKNEKEHRRMYFSIGGCRWCNRRPYRTCSQAKYTAISGLASGCRPPETGAAWNPWSWQYLIATALQQTLINYSYSRSICFYKCESIREERTHTLE